jgi:predicted nucleic acid-binding protein
MRKVLIDTNIYIAFKNNNTRIITHDEITAQFYANVFNALKIKGKPIPTNDIWIAASALQNGLALFTLDSHFTEIECLVIKTDY